MLLVVSNLFCAVIMQHVHKKWTKILQTKMQQFLDLKIEFLPNY